MISYYVYPGLKDAEAVNRNHQSVSTIMRSQTPDHILEKICEFYGQEIGKVKSKSRRREYTWCRQVFFHFCRKYTTMTKEKLGLYMGDRDHTTVIHSERVVQDILDTEPDRISELREIEYMILFQQTIGGKE